MSQLKYYIKSAAVVPRSNQIVRNWSQQLTVFFVSMSVACIHAWFTPFWIILVSTLVNVLIFVNCLSCVCLEFRMWIFFGWNSMESKVKVGSMELEGRLTCFWMQLSFKIVTDEFLDLKIFTICVLDAN
jgi:hypothetical protein